MSAVVSATRDGIGGHITWCSFGVYNHSISSVEAFNSGMSLVDILVSYDIFFRALRASEVDVYLGAGVLPFAASRSDRKIESRPVTSHYHEAKDFQKYGSSIHTLVSLPQILSGAPRGDFPSLDKEKDASHYNWSGAAARTSISHPYDGTPQTFSYWGSGAVTNGVFRRPYDSMYAYRADIDQYLTDGNRTADWVSAAKSLEAYGPILRGQTGSQAHVCHITDVIDSRDMFRFVCTGSLVRPETFTVVNYRYSIIFRKEVMLHEAKPIINTNPWIQWNPGARPVFTLLSFEVNGVSEHRDTIQVENLLSTGSLQFRTGWSRITLGHSDELETRTLRSKVVKESQRFFKEIDASRRDLLSASNFSASDALVKLEGGVSNNLLQTVVKLPALESALPQIREGIQVLSHIVKRDLSLATAKEILDLVSSTTLQASFQWRPMVDLLKTHLPTISKLSRAGASRKKLTIARGVWKYTFLEGELSRPAQLTARTKIVLDESPRGLLAAFLGVDAFGIFPKPSNIWDLLPFSFVANWVTGVGNGIRRAEYSTVLLGMPAVYCHSYLVEAPFRTSELENWNLSTSRENELSMKVYFRDISLYAPLPRNTRFGFGLPTSAPPLGVVGALLYQLFIR